MDVIRDALKPWEQSGIVHDVLPVGTIFAVVLRIILKDQVIVEAEIGILEHHIVRVDRFAFKRVTQVLLQEIEQLSILEHYIGHVWVEHDFLLGQGPLAAALSTITR